MHIPFCSYNTHIFDHFNYISTIVNKKVSLEAQRSEFLKTNSLSKDPFSHITSLESIAYPPLLLIHQICFVLLSKNKSFSLFDEITSPIVIQVFFSHFSFSFILGLTFIIKYCTSIS